MTSFPLLSSPLLSSWNKTLPLPPLNASSPTPVYAIAIRPSTAVALLPETWFPRPRYTTTRTQTTYTRPCRHLHHAHDDTLEAYVERQNLALADTEWVEAENMSQMLGPALYVIGFCLVLGMVSALGTAPSAAKTEACLAIEPQHAAAAAADDAEADEGSGDDKEWVQVGAPVDTSLTPDTADAVSESPPATEDSEHPPATLNGNTENESDDFDVLNGSAAEEESDKLDVLARDESDEFDLIELNEADEYGNEEGISQA